MSEKKTLPEPKLLEVNNDQRLQENVVDFEEGEKIKPGDFVLKTTTIFYKDGKTENHSKKIKMVEPLGSYDSFSESYILDDIFNIKEGISLGDGSMGESTSKNLPKNCLITYTNFTNFPEDNILRMEIRSKVISPEEVAKDFLQYMEVGDFDRVIKKLKESSEELQLSLERSGNTDTSNAFEELIEILNKNLEKRSLRFDIGNLFRGLRVSLKKS